jgi:hypothetical protein
MSAQYHPVHPFALGLHTIPKLHEALSNQDTGLIVIFSVSVGDGVLPISKEM